MAKFYLLGDDQIAGVVKGEVYDGAGGLGTFKPEEGYFVLPGDKLFDHDSYIVFEVTKFGLKRTDDIPNDIEMQIWEYENKPDPETENEPDNVEHLAHYETGKFECIDVMCETQGVDAVIDFCICNGFKYLYRHKRKNGVEDLKKARWYLNKAIELIEGADDD